MGVKGTVVEINPTALVPAISLVKIDEAMLAKQLAAAKAVMDVMQEGKLLAGKRAEPQQALAEEIEQSLKDLSDKFKVLTERTQKVWGEYIDATTQKGIDAMVKAATEKVNQNRNRSKMKGK